MLCAALAASACNSAYSVNVYVLGDGEVGRDSPDAALPDDDDDPPPDGTVPLEPDAADTLEDAGADATSEDARGPDVGDAATDAGADAQERASDPQLEHCTGLGDPAAQAGFRLAGCLVSRPGGATGDGFGAALASTEEGVLVSGNHVNEQGEKRPALFFFKDGVSLETTILGPALADGPNGANAFGAIAYDPISKRIAVALPNAQATSSGETTRGAVLLYARVGAAWQLETTLYPRKLDGSLDVVTSATFGTSITFHQGDLIVTRSAVASTYGEVKGALFVYRERGGSFVFAERLEPPAFTTASGSYVDADYALLSSGDELFVGSHNDDIAATCAEADNPSSRCRSGSVRSYRRATDGTYTPTNLYLAPSDALPKMRFGAAMASWNGALIVGAPGAPIPGSQGSGLVLARFPEAPALLDRLPMVEATSPAQLGASLLPFDDLLIVGGPATNGWSGQYWMLRGQPIRLLRPGVGSVSVYHRDQAGWHAAELFLPYLLREGGARFGRALARHGSHLLVSSGTGSYSAGRVLVFQRVSN